MNKGEIRRRVLEQVDWQPDQSASFKAKVDRLINRAYQTMSLEAPFLFFEEECRIITQSDQSNTTSDTTDVLAINSTDAYVLESTSTTGTTWKYDGTWDGRRIEVTTSGGTVYRRRIREIWQDSVVDGATNTTTVYNRISIDVPWPNNTDTDMAYRIFTDAYDLPADVVEVRSSRIFADYHYPLEVNNQYDMERYEYIDYKGNETGRPYRMYRGRHWQIDAPTNAPVPSIYTEHHQSWIGPEPSGKFDYCYTYTWGYRESELKAPSDHKEPLWESAPSPVSTAIEHPGTTTSAIQVTLPNVDQILNFFTIFNPVTNTVVAPVRTKRSGLKKRLYLRRYTQQSPGNPVIQTPEVFYLLAEVDGHVTTYSHDGKDIPDYYRRLKEVHGYQSVRFWPMPDDNYEIDCRVLRRPQNLINDHDAPRIHEEAVDALIYKTLILLYELQGTAELSQLSEMRYSNLLKTLTKRYGQLDGSRPRKKAARVLPGSREVRVVYKP
tara:strand:- start:5328 stop:6809 length:1482 start_codon:yes stop_codon:yes gene_type:complete